MADPHQLLVFLQEQLPLLSDADQQYVVGCQANIDLMQMPLTTDNIKRLHAIAASVQQLEHSTLEQTAPLSMARILKDLSTAVHMLNPTEHAFALKMSRQVAKGIPLLGSDMSKLLAIHEAKGF